ncbi:long-chain-fatty-acid--CoA ligase [Thermodesulfobacteriota bacterium]
MLIGDIIKFNAKRFKGRLAFKDEGRELTFDQVNKRANAIVHALIDMSVRKGDRIAILMYNCVEYNELLFALPKAGFITVTLNYRLVGRELKYIIDNSESSTLIFGPEFTDTIEEIRPGLESVKNYIVVDRAGKPRGEALEYEQLIDSHPTKEIESDVAETDVAYILYTSGTTGFPKGAMLTHKNIITNLFNQIFEVQPGPRDRAFNLAPLYHCAGQNIPMAFAFYGCPTMTLSQFDPGLVLETIKAEQPNVLHLVPAMQNMVLNHPDVGKYDFSCVELMMYGASSMLQSQLKQSIEIFGCKYIQFAGQTESGPLITCLRPEDHAVDGPEHLIRRLGSAGREVKLTELKIVDEEGHEVPPHTPGEEIARGDNVMKGYWKMPEATANTIVDGWLHTGDICMKDEDGYVYYLDRIKDMICRGGENVYPREIEEVIATHPSIMEVAVIGVPDKRLQEEIMAVIAPKKGAVVPENEIVTLCEENLARYKKVRYVEFRQELPKNASGKILKRELRKKYENQPLPPKI